MKRFRNKLRHQNLFDQNYVKTVYMPGSDFIDGNMKVVRSRDRGRILIKGCIARVCAPLTPMVRAVI